jgi:AbrB family looped-hinge helix DNA binding protein
MSAIRAKISDSGRLSLPAEMRRAIGLERGGDVVIELAGREIRIRPIDEVVAQAQAMTRRLLHGKEASVEDFIAERRKEAAKE